MIRHYTELAQLKTFDERFEYLKLTGGVGVDTFGFDRVFNQRFYKSVEWKQVRNHVILRDMGCDLGIEGREIPNRILIHHMNPISMDDIANATKFLLDPNYLISTSFDTHNAIHYGDISLVSREPITRSMNDTCPWK